MVKIITRSDTNEVASWITSFAPNSTSRLIRIEGVCGSGKTSIARQLEARGVGVHINADDFITRPAGAIPYAGCVEHDKLDAAIASADRTGKVVILDAVCSEEVAPVQRWGQGLRIYVKQLSFNTVDPIWHVGLHLEDAPPVLEPHRSVHLYHLRVLPHMKADLIVEFPEDHQPLPKARFARDRCFDPLGSVVVE